VRDEGRVAAKVLPEGAGGAMDGGPVELDDDALTRPEGVDLDEATAERHVCVEARTRHARAAAEG
jgi:hypothetical protein